MHLVIAPESRENDKSRELIEVDVNRLLHLTLLSALALPILIACSDTGDEVQREPTPVLDEANLTVEEVYQRFAEAIDRPGYVYRTTVSLDQDGGYFRMEGTRTLWVDAALDLARDEYDARITHEEGDRDYNQAEVIANGGEYRPPERIEGGGEPGSKVEARKCYGVNAAVSAVLGCPGWTEESTKKAEIGEYRGRAVVVLITTGARHGEDETTTFTEKLYLDRRTLLPVALEGEGTLGYGKIYPVSWLYKFENDFIPADTLAEDFFDPASIGYVEPDPEAPLSRGDLGITAYWLGRTYAGTANTPPLALQSVRVADPDKGPGYSVTLDYRLADDEFGSTAITLEEWSLSRWNASHIGLMQTDPSAPPVEVGNWWQRPCFETRDIELPAGRAVIVLGFEGDTVDSQPTTPAGEHICPTAPHDRFWVIAYFGSTVIQVDAPGTIEYGGEQAESPYNSIEGMEAIARALQPRQ